MITQRARYALKTMLDLAAVGDEELVQAKDIAKRQQIPIKFLEQILIDLRRAGLVDSRRGRYGGYTLTLPADRISLLQVLRAIDGPVAPLGCLSRTSYQKCGDCEDEATCGVRWLMKGVYEASLHYMETTTIAEGVRQGGCVMEKVKEQEAFAWELDGNGFLADFNNWSEEYARAMAERLGMEDGLREDHFMVLSYIRSFFQTYGQCPLVYQTCRANNLRLRELKQLFPKGYLRGACRLAGLSYRAGYPSFAMLTQYVGGPEEADTRLSEFEIDEYGFLVDPATWSRPFAEALAKKLKLEKPLGEQHWKVLYYLRERFHEEQWVPTVIKTCEDLRLELDEFEDLFPMGYNRGAVRLAGLRPATGQP